MCQTTLYRNQVQEEYVTAVKKCNCGAITVTIEGQDYSMRPKVYKEKFEGFKLDKSKFSCCNHCVNHYGIDICACGSGKHPGKCKEGYSVCGNPHQYLPF